jgi:hypothetical protein
VSARSTLAGGMGLLVLAGIWQFGLSSRWTQRVPPGWSTNFQYVGAANAADPRTGTFRGSGEVEHYDRAQRVISESGRPDWIELEERYTVGDPVTGKPVFEYVTRDTVDPRTGAHADTRHRGEIALFPREVEPHTYGLRSNYVEGIALTFERRDVLEGLPTFVFSYRGPLDQTDVYANSGGALGGLRVASGQVIRCLDDQFYYRIWVEPATGEQIKLEEGCPSGDYIHDSASGRPVAAIAQWTGVTAGDDLTSRILEIRAERWKYLWASRYIGLTLVLAGAVLAAIGMRPRAVRG